METSKKVKELLKKKGKGLVDENRVNEISIKIKQLEKEGLIIRQNYTLPQIDTIGAEVSTSGSKKNKDRRYLYH